MSFQSTRLAASTSLLLAVVVAYPVDAQEEPQPVLIPQFSFSNPGARSLGLGGAFVALADDATAAWANPAGLVQITRPEVSIEGRQWSYSTVHLAGGRAAGDPSGIGLDTVSGIRTGTSEDDLASLAFASVVYPRNRWSLAVYRHVLSDFETEFQTEGLFADGSGCCPTRFLDQRSRSSFGIDSYGLAGAYRITDSFSLGIGIVYYDVSTRVDSELYLWDDLQDVFGSPTTYLPERWVGTQSLIADDQDTRLTGGFLWNPTPRWSFGGKYRQGPEVEFSGIGVVGPALDLGLPPGSVIVFSLGESARLPDNFGLGASFRSSDGRLTLGVEWDRVTYSDPLESLGIDDQEIDDADQFHLGTEWAFLQARPLIALRAGAWLDPDHLARANERADEFTRAFLQGGDDEVHFALGLGVAFQRFQIDGAADFSDSVNTVSLSVIYSWD